VKLKIVIWKDKSRMTKKLLLNVKVYLIQIIHYKWVHHSFIISFQPMLYKCVEEKWHQLNGLMLKAKKQNNINNMLKPSYSMKSKLQCWNHTLNYNWGLLCTLTK